MVLLASMGTGLVQAVPGWCRYKLGRKGRVRSTLSHLCMGTPQGSIRVKMLWLGCTMMSDKSQINSEFSVPGGTRRWRRLTSSILLSMVMGSR